MTRSMNRMATALFVLLLAPAAMRAQQDEEAADTTLTGAWQESLLASVSFAQAAYDNWRAGGENTVAFKVAIDGSAERSTGVLSQSHSLQFAYGKSRVGDQGVRKVDDVLRYLFELALNGERTFKPILTLDARTQIDKGFDYGEDPAEQIAAFMSPAYVVEALGVAFDPRPWIRLRLGMGGKQTIVLEESLRESYGVDPEVAVKSEAGANFGALIRRELVTNVVLKSELSVFEAVSNLRHPDVRWKNLVQLQVNSYISTNLELELFYDQDAWDGLQLRQTLGIGLAVTVI